MRKTERDLKSVIVMEGIVNYMHEEMRTADEQKTMMHANWIKLKPMENCFTSEQ